MERSYCAGGDVQWSDGVSPDLPPARSIEDLKNHYDRHTKYCSACQKVQHSEPFLHLCMLSASRKQLQR